VALRRIDTTAVEDDLLGMIIPKFLNGFKTSGDLTFGGEESGPKVALEVL
jgi:hypothetical protein